jgi:hypothetical protein
LVANITYKMTPRFFPPKRWNRFFAIYVVRLALYVFKKKICDGVGGQDELNGITLYPPLFWVDNIFKFMTDASKTPPKSQILFWNHIAEHIAAIRKQTPLLLK